jgi:hypothetical protein
LVLQGIVLLSESFLFVNELPWVVIDPRQLPPIGAGRPYVDIVVIFRRNGARDFRRNGTSFG